MRNLQQNQHGDQQRNRRRKTPFAVLITVCIACLVAAPTAIARTNIAQNTFIPLILNSSEIKPLPTPTGGSVVMPPTATSTGTATAMATVPATATNIPVATLTPVATSVVSATMTATVTATATSTITPTVTPTASATATTTATATSVATATPVVDTNTTVTITIEGLTFNPATVTIKPGDTVVWKNSPGFHNVRSDDAEFRLGVGEDGSAGTDWDTVSFTFDTVGEYRYYCEPHEFQGMEGIVKVEE